MATSATTLICLALLLAYACTLIRLHDRRSLAFLLPAVLVTACLVGFETLLVMHPLLLYRSMKPLLFLQVLLCPCWLLFSLSYARQASWSHWSRLDFGLFVLCALVLALVLALPASTFYYQTDFVVERLFFLEQRAFFLMLFLIVVLLLAIGDLEGTLRNSRHGEQWRIKLALLGAGTVLASMVFFYSQGLLTRAIDLDNLPFRNSAVAIGLCFMLYAEWRRKSANVAISRRVAFRSLAVTAAGLYLLALGLLREGARIFGNTFTQDMGIALVVVLLLATAVVAMSQSVRRKASIWVQRHLHDEKYDYRKQWTLFSERLAQSRDSASLLGATLLSFCETFGRVRGFFIPVDHNSDTGFGEAVHYETEEETARMLGAEERRLLLELPPVPLVLDEATPLPETLAGHLRALNVSLVLPIHAGGEPEGLLFLGEAIDEKEHYDAEDIELMKAMGGQVGLCVRSFRLSDELTTAREMEALGRLSTFVLHDLKNQVYALSLLTDNARRHIADPEFQADMLETLGNTVANMRILISQLSHLPSAANMRFAPVDLHSLAVRACNQVPGGSISISGTHPVVSVDAEQFSKVITNLCLNAVEAGGDKPIRIEIDEEDVPVFRIHDQAGGIAPEIMQKGLFKPFFSTKQRGMGIGLYHSRKIVEAHGATMLVDNRPGQGCTFTIRFEGKASPQVLA